MDFAGILDLLASFLLLYHHGCAFQVLSLPLLSCSSSLLNPPSATSAMAKRLSKLSLSMAPVRNKIEPAATSKGGNG